LSSEGTGEKERKSILWGVCQDRKEERKGNSKSKKGRDGGSSSVKSITRIAEDESFSRIIGFLWAFSSSLRVSSEMKVLNSIFMIIGIPFF